MCRTTPDLTIFELFAQSALHGGKGKSSPSHAIHRQAQAKLSSAPSTQPHPPLRLFTPPHNHRCPPVTLLIPPLPSCHRFYPITLGNLSLLCLCRYPPFCGSDEGQRVSPEDSSLAASVHVKCVCVSVCVCTCVVCPLSVFPRCQQPLVWLCVSLSVVLLWDQLPTFEWAWTKFSTHSHHSRPAST